MSPTTSPAWTARLSPLTATTPPKRTDRSRTCSAASPVCTGGLVTGGLATGGVAARGESRGGCAAGGLVVGGSSLRVERFLMVFQSMVLPWATPLGLVKMVISRTAPEMMSIVDEPK